MVIEPRSHVALMREPRASVAGRYFVWIACMVLNRALIARQRLPLPIASRGGSGNPVKNRAQRPLQFLAL